MGGRSKGHRRDEQQAVIHTAMDADYSTAENDIISYPIPSLMV